MEFIEAWPDSGQGMIVRWGRVMWIIRLASRIVCAHSVSAAILMLCVMQSARAEEFALSIGRETSGRNDAALALEARTTPVLRLTDRIAVRLAAATELQTSGDLWVGAGAHASAPLSARWRVEISVLPGLYSRGTSGDDLGHTVQFRSRIAISLAFAPRWRIGAAFQHKSNASLGDNNPGAETLLATVSFAP